ncbi:hypothetical protein, partial [Escherichia coli]|uniref:hypothetical protein n=1 Tax=Escherichia coli TaxID=562 RepID=UPI001BC8C57D
LLARLAEESVQQKRQLQCLKQEWEQRIAALQHRLDHKLMRIEQLKQQRKQRSAALQKKLFSAYRFTNIRGVERIWLSYFP